MYISLSLEPEKTKELEQYIKAILPEIINEHLFEDTNSLRKMINECVKGQIKAHINDILQGKDFRNFLRDKIMQEIGTNDKKVT